MKLTNLNLEMNVTNKSWEKKLHISFCNIKLFMKDVHLFVSVFFCLFLRFNWIRYERVVDYIRKTKSQNCFLPLWILTVLACTLFVTPIYHSSSINELNKFIINTWQLKSVLVNIQRRRKSIVSLTLWSAALSLSIIVQLTAI